MSFFHRFSFWTTPSFTKHLFVLINLVCLINFVSAQKFSSFTKMMPIPTDAYPYRCTSLKMPISTDAHLYRCLSLQMPISTDDHLNRCPSLQMTVSTDAHLYRCTSLQMLISTDDHLYRWVYCYETEFT